MRRIARFLVYCAVLLLLTGCGSDSGTSRHAEDRLTDVLETLADPGEQTDVAEQAYAAADEPAEKEEPVPVADNIGVPDPEEEPSSGDGIDLDLTTLSATMVYSEVYNIMISPKAYIGKTIKMDGLFSRYHDDVSDKDYFACIIQDATACCSQGIEFELTEEYSYPEDYPEEGGEICVVGVFDTYQEGETTYCTLRNGKLVEL